MKLKENIKKNVSEVKYLNVENTYRYRTIIRFLYKEYKKTKWLIYKEDIFRELKQYDEFKNYTKEECELDLEKLCEWGNLKARQDTKNFKTIDEYKNKKFRYEITKPTIEIEKMITHLENLHIETFSLEPNLIERIALNIKKINNLDPSSFQENSTWWEDLCNDFERLNENYRNYMKKLESNKSEKLSQTLYFIAFKDSVVNYLNKFVTSLQRNTSLIESYFKKIDRKKLEEIFENIISYQLSIPNNEKIDKNEYREVVFDRFNNLEEWFVGKNDEESEVDRIEKLTIETIDKITKYAVRLTSFTNNSHNRKAEYYGVAKKFYELESLEEAHKLSAYIFGINKLLKLRLNLARETDSINSSVYEEKPAVIRLKSKNKKRREKQNRSEMLNNAEDKRKQKEEYLLKIKKERDILQDYIVNNRLEFSKLQLIEENTMLIFLSWLRKAFQNSDYTYRTENGENYYIENPKETTRCVLKSTSGTLDMPAFVLVFDKKEKL